MATSPTLDPPDAERATSGRSGETQPSRTKRRSLVSPKVRRAIFAPPRHPWLAAAAVIVVLLVVAELWVRWVKPQLPVVRSGDAAEMVLKGKRIEELATAQRQIDVLFVGTSMMDSAIAPREFLSASRKFHTAYNASIVGAPPATQTRWVTEVALENLQPELIVVGIHPFDLLANDPLELNIQPGQADVVFARVERELRGGALGAVDRSLNDHVELVAQRGALRQPGVMAEATWNQYRGNDPKPFIPLRDEDYWKRQLEPDGTSRLFHGHTYRPTKALTDLAANMHKQDFSVQDVDRLLSAVRARAEQIDADVVVVIPPVPVEEWKNGGVDLASLREGEQLIAAAAARYHVGLIDFTDRNYTADLFADILHSNDKGAVRFSRDLVAELERR